MRNTSQDPDYVGPVGHEKKFHKDHFQGVDTSFLKVWVLKRGRLVRVTKEQAMRKGYKVVAETKKRPNISHVWNAAGAPVGREVTNGNP